LRLLTVILLIFSLGFAAEVNANDTTSCVVTQHDVDKVALLHKQSLSSYISWYNDRNLEIIYPYLPSKFKSWAGREIGTSSSVNKSDVLYESYLFDYVEFVQFSTGCEFHSELTASPLNTKKIIKIQTSVYSFEGGPGIVSKPKITL
jgi:hypothetical protein